MLSMTTFYLASRSSSGYISRLTVRNLIDRPVGFKVDARLLMPNNTIQYIEALKLTCREPDPIFSVMTV
jgi:hypothetical protein